MAMKRRNHMSPEKPKIKEELTESLKPCYCPVCGSLVILSTKDKICMNCRTKIINIKDPIHRKLTINNEMRLKKIKNTNTHRINMYNQLENMHLLLQSLAT